MILGRSFCPSCKNALTIKNLIPFFSWFFQRGHCSFCGKRISFRYPLIELFSALSFLLVYLATDGSINLHLLWLFIITTILLIMIITDLEHYFIPNSTQIALFIVAIIYHLTSEESFGFQYYAISAASFLLFGLALHYGFLFIAKKHAIGIDDIKFFTVAGFLLGVHQFPIFMIFSGLIGMVFGSIWQKLMKDTTFPFAPALAISLMICLLFGNILASYLY